MRKFSQYFEDLVEEKQRFRGRPETMPEAAELLKSIGLWKKTTAEPSHGTTLRTNAPRGLWHWISPALKRATNPASRVGSNAQVGTTTTPKNSKNLNAFALRSSKSRSISVLI